MKWYDDPDQQSKVRTYMNAAAMKREIAQAAPKGWAVESNIETKARPLIRLIIPIWWLFFPVSRFVVTFRRVAA